MLTLWTIRHPYVARYICLHAMQRRHKIILFQHTCLSAHVSKGELTGIRVLLDVPLRQPFSFYTQEALGRLLRFE